MNFIPKSLIEDAKNINANVARKSQSKRTSLPKTEKLPIKPFARASLPRREEENLVDEEVDANQEMKSNPLNIASEENSVAEVTYDSSTNRYSYAKKISTDPRPSDSSELHAHISEESQMITRRQVIKLKEMMDDFIKTFDADQAYSNDMDAFIKTIREEQKIYESVFMEVIKQVSIQMIERGEILGQIRARYSTMFRRIPERVVGMYNDLVAHKKLNRRLAEELQRAQQNIADLAEELNAIKGMAVYSPSDQSVTEQNSAELAEFYKSEIDRLNSRAEQSEKEKNLWILATTNLSKRISDNYGMKNLQSLFKCEESRIRTTNHIMSIIRFENTKDYNELKECLDAWQDEVGSLSSEIIKLDRDNGIELNSVGKELKKMILFLKVTNPENGVEADHELLKDFKDFDLQFIKCSFETWKEKLASVYSRYAKENESRYRVELARCREVTRTWAETGYKILRRYEDCASGVEFKQSGEALRDMQHLIYSWFSKMEIIIHGDDGISNNLLIVKTEVEDSSYIIQTLKKIESLKRDKLIKSMEEWLSTIGSVASKFAQNTGNEHILMPSRIINWIENLSAIMNRDHDTRNEVTIKWHADLIDWVVNVLLPGQRENYSLVVYQEALFKRIHSFNTNLILDSADLEMLSDDKRDLRKLLRDLAQNLEYLTGKLLQQDIASLIPPLEKKEFAIPKADRIY